MNRTYRSIWNEQTSAFVAVPENASSAGKKTSSCRTAPGGGDRFALKALTLLMLLAMGSSVQALPTGGVVAAGNASISTGARTTTINQTTQNAAINWQSFSIGSTETVRIVQPNNNSVMLNRVLGSDPSSILGTLSANGKVFLVNPNGILFGPGASVNVGGLVASTLNIQDSDFMAGRYKFVGAGGEVRNRGTINADGGFVALLGAKVSNDGNIVARLGTVALAAGNAITLDVAGDGLLNITVDQGAVNALAQNGGLIQADGGQVLLTAQSAGSLLPSAVNNTGVIQAQTLVTGENGSIMLMGDMRSGTVNVGGTLDASAPNGGNGGFIETSAAHVKIASDANITTDAPAGVTGTWLIDPVDFNIQAIGGDITGVDLTALLVNNNVTISTMVTGTNTATTFFAAPGQGDINVNDAIGTGASWTAVGNATTLTLMAARDVNINNAISATNGNLVVCCGQDVNVRAAITTTNGSVSLSAGRDVTLFAGSAMTTTNGNIQLCAGRDVIVDSKITLTNSGSIADQSLGLPLGLTLIAGANGSGPGVASGSVYLPGPADPLRPSVTRSEAPATDIAIYYNPTSYATPTNYSTNFITVGAVTLTQYMLVYPGVTDKTFNGDTTATLSGFKSTALSGLVPGTVTLLAGPGATANFDSAAVGTDKTVTFSGYSLAQDPIVAGGNAANYALPVDCCASVGGKTAGNIIAAVVEPLPTGTEAIETNDAFDVEHGLASPSSLVAAPTWVPTVEHATTPPQLLALAPPPVMPEPAPAPAPVLAPVQAPPAAYVAPRRLRKQDRN
ncbi:MAG: filamentous hemagglutinin [Betaproteobacteria bacterium HGW-Betaproteobacteria-7]|jgi:filamentous hemagglutinin family protein|nr:MAG: filamentous hemagglutinin [Betaproteobacteria bacterium HGW-Betaproteobacteria-7]